MSRFFCARDSKSQKLSLSARRMISFSPFDGAKSCLLPLHAHLYESKSTKPTTVIVVSTVMTSAHRMVGPIQSM